MNRRRLDQVGGWGIAWFLGAAFVYGLTLWQWALYAGFVGAVVAGVAARVSLWQEIDGLLGRKGANMTSQDPLRAFAFAHLPDGTVREVAVDFNDTARSLVAVLSDTPARAAALEALARARAAAIAAARADDEAARR